MKLDDEFKTRTMAQILAAQGQTKKAKAIYSYLIKQKPHHEDLKAELDALDKKTLLPKQDTKTDLMPLYQQWIQTAIFYYSKNSN